MKCLVCQSIFGRVEQVADGFCPPCHARAMAMVRTELAAMSSHEIGPHSFPELATASGDHVPLGGDSWVPVCSSYRA